jgi:hypothetical protein
MHLYKEKETKFLGSCRREAGTVRGTCIRESELEILVLRLLGVVTFSNRLGMGN